MGSYEGSTKNKKTAESLLGCFQCSLETNVTKLHTNRGLSKHHSRIMFNMLQYQLTFASFYILQANDFFSISVNVNQN